MKRVIIAIFLFFLVSPASALEMKPDDFSYGVPLKTTGMDALCELPLPAEVYRDVTRGDLGDLCVFNGRGEVVPYALYRVTQPHQAPVELRNLPLFPIAGGAGLKSDGMSLQVRRSPGGSIIRVETADRTAKGKDISSYLLDASSIRRPVAALELEWEPRPEGLVGRIRVEGSDDLESWSVLVPDAAVMDLRYGDHALERRTIEIAGAGMNYYRLSSSGAGEMPRLSAVKARIAPEGREHPRQWSRIAASPRKDEAGDYLFELPGHMPVDRIRVRLPQENTLVTVSFFSRATERDPWKADGSALAYRLRIRGEEVTGPDIVLNPSTDRYRLMRVDRSGGGLGSGTPVIEFGWVPGRLLFVARGAGPFLLAYASARHGQCARSGDDLFRRFAAQRGGRYRTEVAVAGPPIILGGKAALRRPLVPADPETAILWAVLLLGVALLAWMAFRLHGQMEKKGDEKGNDASGSGGGKQT
jgi:hypothetical protein